jgi:hypothetical protein
MTRSYSVDVNMFFVDIISSFSNENSDFPGLKEVT